MKWHRKHNADLDDPAIQRLSDRQYRHLDMLRCYASELDNDGRVPGLSDCAWRLRVPVATLDKSVTALLNLGLLRTDGDGYQFAQWSDQQFKSDNVNERVRDHRNETKKLREDRDLAASNEGSGASHETLHETLHATGQNRTEERETRREEIKTRKEETRERSAPDGATRTLYGLTVAKRSDPTPASGTFVETTAHVKADETATEPSAPENPTPPGNRDRPGADAPRPPEPADFDAEAYLRSVGMAS